MEKIKIIVNEKNIKAKFKKINKNKKRKKSKTNGERDDYIQSRNDF